MLDPFPSTGESRRFLHEIPVAEVAAKKRWSRDDWIVYAFDAMEREGVGAVRIEELARRSGRTPGSFYAHFKSRDELLEAMLKAWTEFKLAATMKLDSALYRAGEFSLEGIFERIRRGTHQTARPGLEIAMREWARIDKRARAAVTRTDMLRMNNGTAMVLAEFPNAHHPQVFTLMFLWLLRGRWMTFTDPKEKALAESWDLAAAAFVRMYQGMAEKFHVPGAPRWIGKFRPISETPAGVPAKISESERASLSKKHPKPPRKRRRR